MTPAESAAIDREQVTTLYREKIASLRAEVERLAEQRDAAREDAESARGAARDHFAAYETCAKECDTARSERDAARENFLRARDARDLAFVAVGRGLRWAHAWRLGAKMWRMVAHGESKWREEVGAAADRSRKWAKAWKRRALTGRECCRQATALAADLAVAARERDAVAAVLDDVLKERDEWRQVAETSHRLHCEASDRDLAARAESGAMRGALREVVEWCDAGRCIEGIQVGGGLEAALSAARAALKGTR